MTKMLEVRDAATLIPVFAFRAQPAFGGKGMAQNWLLARAGFGNRGDSSCVIFGRLDCAGISMNCTYDPFSWRDRTMQTAHQYVQRHFDELKDGDVVDVQHILGETSTPKQSERITCQ